MTMKKLKTTKKKKKNGKTNKFKLWHFDISKTTKEDIEKQINTVLNGVKDPELELTVDRDDTSLIIYVVYRDES